MHLLEAHGSQSSFIFEFLIIVNTPLESVRPTGRELRSPAMAEDPGNLGSFFGRHTEPDLAAESPQDQLLFMVTSFL